jgi:hypothetical protein
MEVETLKELGSHPKNRRKPTTCRNLTALSALAILIHCEKVSEVAPESPRPTQPRS